MGVDVVVHDLHPDSIRRLDFLARSVGCEISDLFRTYAAVNDQAQLRPDCFERDMIVKLHGSTAFERAQRLEELYQATVELAVQSMFDTYTDPAETAVPP